MTKHQPREAGAFRGLLPSSTARYCAWVLMALAIAYAFLAGFHTLQEFDLGWQLASGRWIVQHRQIPSQDVFSYTAPGQQWIYPVLSEIAFYLVYRLGGYSLLSWIGAGASAGTTALLMRRGGFITIVLALLAVPLIANRTQPRADMFTTILFAAFLRLLWEYYRTGRGALWLLPVLMVAWVNLHLGFVAGLVLCLGYLLQEVLDVVSAEKRSDAIDRLRRSWRWLALTALATFVNPWGPYIYAALIRQERAQAVHAAWVVEWAGIQPSWTSLQQALGWRDPQSSVWWILAAAILGFFLAVWRKQFGAAAWLAAAAYLALRHVRFQALLACVVVIVGGSILEDFLADRTVERKTKVRAAKTDSPLAAPQERWVSGPPRVRWL
jgi:hypothetical protein